MVRLGILMGAMLLCAVPSGASNAVSLGYSDETMMVGPGTDACASGTLIYDHDGSFESAYCWQYAGCQPPYFGAFGEAYDLGSGIVRCGAFWLTDFPNMVVYPSADCYVWEGGTGTAPNAVLGVVAGVDFPGIPNWPSIGQYDVEMNLTVTGPFTVGYWPDWPDAVGWWFCAADENGPGGHPWTCIAPGIEYPSGWQDPSVIEPWAQVKAMGCGAYFEQATPAQSETWGAIKAMFRR